MAAVGVCVMGGMGVGAYVGRQISAKQKQEAALILERYRQRQSQHPLEHEHDAGGLVELQRLRHRRRTDDDDDQEEEDDGDEEDDDDDEYGR
jgi:hypothetical protein